MTGLLQVGELPKRTRSPGRKPGKWRGHERMAHELQVLAGREHDPDRRWGKVAEQESSSKSQAIAGAIKRGEAIGFEITDVGGFEATTFKCEDLGEDGKPVYDVWARWMPHAEQQTSDNGGVYPER